MSIDKILKDNESRTFELKEKLNDSVFKTLSAFSNTDGGILVIGISDRKRIIGINWSNTFIEDVTNKIVNKLGIHPEIECLEAKGKKVIKIKVIKETLPVSYEGKYYKRVGNTTREMKGEELRTFFVKDTNWDTITGNFGIDEIDEKTVRNFLKTANRIRRLRMADEDEDIESVLKKLKLIVKGKLTNGAILLFGKNPQKYFTNAVVRIGRLKNEITIIGDRLIEGNLFTQAQEAEEALKNFINVRYEISGDEFERKNIWDYPLDAVREALFNALIHRDYFRYNVQTQIKIFDYNMWFFNIGSLPEGITLEQLKKPHPSIARNPLIVHVFYLAGFIEEYGSGIGRILESIQDHELPEPEFKEEYSGFSVYFHKDIFTEDNLIKMGLNQRQIKAVIYVKKKGKITNSEYQSLTGVKKRQATDDIKSLVTSKFLRKEGVTGKGTYYVLKGRQRGERGTKGAPKGQ